MTRLRHSYAGYLRLMQISRTQLYVFVEGKQCDPYFYSQICETAINNQINYDISMAQQLPGDSGGKQKLLQFFTYLRSRKKLVMNLGGCKTTCVFFLDKDVDDILKTRKRSPHVVYTKHYDVQNYVFENGDLIKGSGAAASIDSRNLNTDLQDAPTWCKRIISLWADWIALCLFVRENGPACEANYRVTSRVQTRPCEGTDPTSFQSLVHDIAKKAGVTASDLRLQIAQYRNKVDKHLKNGNHHKIFKGKWFGAILADEIDRIMAGLTYDKKGLSGNLPGTIAATLDFAETWAEDFKHPLLNVVSML